jgi:CYTH domain-containing protein
MELKLTQKYRDPAMPSSDTVITNFYLNESEFEALRSLGGRLVRKRRYDVFEAGRKFAIDVFEDDLSGLVLAETELANDEEAANSKEPSFSVMEVTNEVLFTGGGLVTIGPDELRSELARRLGS